MNFDFSTDQLALGGEVRRFLDANCPSATVRGVLEGPQSFDRNLYKGLADLGALGIAIPEEYGGTGFGALELCLIAQELGRALAPVPVLSSIYLVADALMRAGSEEQKRRWLPGLASGEVVGCFAIDEGAGRLTPDLVRASVSGARLSGVKFPVCDGDCADLAVVVARSGTGNGERSISLYLVDLSDPGVRRETLDTIDPTRGHARLTFDDVPVEPLGEPGDGWYIAEQVIDRAAVLVAFEQLGGADQALEAARDYALERIAFGRPIGSFQAIKHMLADMYVSAALARSNAYYGAYALASGSADLGVAAATARIAATQAYQLCARNNIQVHGGAGFTWEYDCHLHYRRSNLLALTLGSTTAWEDSLIARMCEANAALVH